MKEAVNQQQNKLSEFLPIKNNSDKNHYEFKISALWTKNQRLNDEKENAPKVDQMANNNFDV